MPTVDEMREKLTQAPQQVISKPGLQRAAVALILCDRPGGAEILFIERAQRAGDPWSGHMAFPGGRMEAQDETPLETAMRETEEEVGLSLARADYLGPLADLQGSPRFRQNRLVVSAHIFHAREPGPIALDPMEVESAIWFPVAEVIAPDRGVAYRTSEAQGLTFPGILVGDPDRHVVWGLTYRFLEIFMKTIGAPLPDHEFVLGATDEANPT